jgi:predicted nuclease of predicted toxin-antitoxin system
MNYQIVADESVDFRIVNQLRQLGLYVYSIAEETPSVTDKFVLSISVEKKALLITEDKDFGELVFRLQLPHQGILLIRIKEAENKIISVATAIENHYEEMLNKFSVIDNNKLRIKE